jgi:hypothetical protein
MAWIEVIVIHFLLEGMYVLQSLRMLDFRKYARIRGIIFRRSLIMKTEPDS